jgi:RNA polymerase sigma-70 factor, ECF subfamily
MDETLFIKIYDEFASKIYTYCYFKVSTKEEAEDIAAQVFMRAWDSLSHGTEIKNVRAFLYRIAHNLVVDHYRRGHKTIPLNEEEHAPILVDTSVPLEESMDHKIILRRINEHLEHLPESYREAVVLRFINDLEIKEIADIMGITQNNVSVILNRAIKKLKTLIPSDTLS